MNSYYQTIEKESIAEFKDRGSKFIAYAFPTADTDAFKLRLSELKKEHPKAVHHCFAYRLGFSGETFRAFDDGEPSGSAGKPILGQIDSHQLTHVAIVVVRYFGGTLLGVPGLINAYKTASSLALQTVPFVQKPLLAHFVLEFDYLTMNDVMVFLRQFGAHPESQEVNLFCCMKVSVPKTKAEEFEYKVNELRGVVCKKQQ
ncbi:MAG: hypothetical protein RIR96_883 [Bacteroidota bacterium]